MRQQGEKVSARPRWTAFAALVALIAAGGAWWLSGDSADADLSVALLLADDTDLKHPVVTAWLDVAREEGISLTPIRASELVRPLRLSRVHYAGVILPDTVHKVAGDALLQRLGEYVNDGGKLMVVYDAATLTLPERAYARGGSRLSELVGINYALYDRIRDHTIASSEVLPAAPGTQGLLRVPPGKLSTAEQTKASLHTYLYGAVRYAHFPTRGDYTGQRLLNGDNGQLLAGIRQSGNGKAAFVNLQLGWLKSRTDGLLLHGFLHWFAVDVCGLPMLAAAPDGRGGLVMNWHVDSSAALPALERLKGTSIFSQGPYSVHFTAGPDLDHAGDGLGMDIPEDPKAKQWVRFFLDRGDAVGSHGGWIHNWFGRNVAETNRPDFEHFILDNNKSLAAIVGRPLEEYSAPLGNHPEWTTGLLEQQDILAYYFVGDTGLGPTRPYRFDRRSFQEAWAFPVLTYGALASFEDMHAQNVPETVVGQWLEDVSAFVADNHVIRLVYFHPPGILYYTHAIDRWMARTKAWPRRGAMPGTP